MEIHRSEGGILQKAATANPLSRLRRSPPGYTRGCPIATGSSELVGEAYNRRKFRSRLGTAHNILKIFVAPRDVQVPFERVVTLTHQPPPYCRPPPLSLYHIEIRERWRLLAVARDVTDYPHIELSFLPSFLLACFSI